MKWTVADGCGLDDVLSALSAGREVYALEADEHDGYRFSRAETWQPGHHVLGRFRQTEPLKALFFLPREFLGTFDGTIEQEPMAERIVFGVKNCDLSSLRIHDHVFMTGAGVDPTYAEAREHTLLVSTDCEGYGDRCFCAGVGEQPYALKGYDINIAVTDAGPVIDAGSERGAAAVRAVESCLQPAGPELLDAVDNQRKQKYDDLAAHSEKHGVIPGTDLRQAVEGSFKSTLWQDFAEDCVECGACNFICCTCHCFLLTDGLTTEGQPARTKQWDACLFNGFGATAGGHNVRPFRAERFRHRFDKKFRYFPEVLDTYACDGCGRCTDACIAKIDIRDVLKRAVEEGIA